MIRPLILLALCGGLGACIGYERHIETHGLTPHAELLTALERTTIAVSQLEEAMGAPSYVTPQPDGVVLWIYDATASRSNEARLLPLLQVRWQSEGHERTVFEVRDSTVTGYRRETR